MEGEQTTLRNLTKDLAALEAGTEAKIQAIKEDVTEVKGDVKEILSAVRTLELHRAETAGRDRVLVWGGSGIVAVSVSWLSKQLGLS